jgi:branched-chain amino acid transport system permease protein
VVKHYADAGLGVCVVGTPDGAFWGGTMMDKLRALLRSDGFYLLMFVFLLLFPYLVGWLTNSNPLGVLRGSRYIMGGQSTFWQSVLIEIFALSILVMSYNLMFGFTGVVSFGHALFFGLGGYIVGMMVQFSGLDPLLAFGLAVLITVLVCAGIGFIIGLATLRLKGVYFAIFTLAVAEMVWIYFGRLPLTNGEDGLTMSNLPALIDPSQNRLILYYVSFALFVLTFAFIRRLVNSPTGAVLKSIRENEERSQAIGYNTVRFKLFAIVVASTMAGGAGIIHAVLAKSARPEFLGVGYTVDALLMTIIGGVGTLTGPIIGAGGLHLADVTLRNAKITLGSTVINVGDSWNFILGLVFVLVVLVFPYGVVGTFQQWRAKRQRSRQQ